MNPPRPLLDRSRDSESLPDSAAVAIITEICRFLRKNRVRGYLVGGFLRDRLLGSTSQDLDVVIEGARPRDLASHLSREMGFSRPVVFPRFKTALTVGQGMEIEVCQLQGDLEEDAHRRDFTVNCFYASLGAPVRSISDLTILDPSGRGRTDLRKRLLRTPVDPCYTIWLDPLRMMRALRLGAMRGFRMDPALRECIPRMVYLLSRVAAERIRAELETILLSSKVVSVFREMEALGVCGFLLPELSRTCAFDQSTPYHAYDLFTHTLKATANTPPDLVLRLAALFHDLGKPATRTMKGGRAVYYGHEELSEQMARRVMERLKFPKRIRERVAFLVRHHMIHYSEAWSDRAVRRFVRKMGPHLEAVLELAGADQKAQIPRARRPLPSEKLRKRIIDLEQSRSIHLAPPIGGHEIMAVLGIPEGPLVGRAKERLMDEASKRDRPMSREEAVKLVRKWFKKRSGR
jgi:putative nucleotidyltransferase with HDIG domain